MMQPMGGPMMMGQMGGPMMMPPQMMMAPVPSNIPPGTPPGLAFLLGVSSIVIKQQVEIAEVLIGINTNNRYDIMDGLGRRMYLAAENSGGCAILCMGACRAWQITVYDSFGQPVMMGQRDSSCCGSCGNSVQVTTPQGQMLGGVLQNCECVSASWDITDSTGQSILTLEAPCCSVICPGCATCCQAEFPLKTKDGEQVGNVMKQFGSLLREMYTAADTFTVSFPPDLDVTVKATLIFATFLIDFMYYEEQPDNSGGGGRGRRGRGYGGGYGGGIAGMF